MLDIRSSLPSPHSGAAWVAVAGELDIAGVPELDRTLRGVQSDHAMAVLDLRALEFIDSIGAQLLVAAHRRALRAGGRLVVVRGPVIDWLFELIGLDRELELIDHAAASPLFEGIAV